MCRIDTAQRWPPAPGSRHATPKTPSTNSGARKNLLPFNITIVATAKHAAIIIIIIINDPEKEQCIPTVVISPNSNENNAAGPTRLARSSRIRKPTRSRPGRKTPGSETNGWRICRTRVYYLQTARNKMVSRRKL